MTSHIDAVTAHRLRARGYSPAACERFRRQPPPEAQLERTAAHVDAVRREDWVVWRSAQLLRDAAHRASERERSQQERLLEANVASVLRKRRRRSRTVGVLLLAALWAALGALYHLEVVLAGAIAGAGLNQHLATAAADTWQYSWGALLVGIGLGLPLLYWIRS